MILTRQFAKEEWYWSICPEADNLSPLKDFLKNRTLASFYLTTGISCALATQPLRLYMLHICLKNRPYKKFMAGGIPFAQISTSRWM
jgi:hypothetical protein